MAYEPIAPLLANGSVLTQDHIAHLEGGILNADVDSREYIDGIAQQIQAGQVTDPAFDAAVDRAAADGRLIVEGGGSAPISVTEVQQGVYELTSGENSATLYGLTSTQTLPAAAKTDLRADFATNEAIAAAGYLTTVADTAVASHVTTTGTTTRAAVETLAAAPAQAVRTDLTPTNGKRPVGKDELVLNAKDFGAKGDGTTDDTAALQSFVNAVTRVGSNSYGTRGYIPAGTYRVTATIVFPARERWSLYGAGMDVTRIVQATDNIPIFNISGSAGSMTHSYHIEGFGFDYANVQPAANTNATCILTSQEVFQGTWRSLKFTRGFYGIRVANGIGCPWGHTFDDLVFTSEMTGGAFDWSTGVNGVPNNHFGRIFVDAKNMTNTIFHLRGYNFTIDTIEIIAANQGPQLFSLAPGGAVTVGTMKIENGVYPAGKRLWEVGVNAYARIGHLTVTGHTMQFTGGDSYILYTNQGARLEVGLLDVTPSLVNVGRVFAVGGANTTGEVVLEKYVKGSLTTGLSNMDSMDIAQRLTVRNQVNRHISGNRGDADYTVVLGDPATQSFETAFTAPRTFSLPSKNNDLFNGLTYEFRFKGAINGANTATIACNGTTKHVQSTDSAVVGFTYRRNINAPSGWMLTKYETLP